MGNPIRSSDGAKIERTLDIAPNQNGGFNFGKTYSSKQGGWNFDLPKPEDNFIYKYNADILPPASGWKWWHISLPGGMAVDITKSELSGQFSILSPNGDIFIISTEGEVFTLGNRDGLRYSINSNTGVLVSQADQNGNKYTYGYTGNLLEKMTDDKGSSLSFYRTNNSLDCVQSSWGTAVHYIYDGLGRLVKSGAGVNCLSRPLGFVYKIYHYENVKFPNALTGITDEKGIRYATWKYDDVGRAFQSFHAGGADFVNIDFLNSTQSAVTNSLGKRSIYNFVDVAGVGKLVESIAGEPTPNCMADKLYQSYYPNGTIKTVTHKNGSVTLFERDEVGRVVTEKRGLHWPTATPGLVTTDLQPPSDLAGLVVIQTCWHPTLNQPSRIIEPTRITLFDYNANGQLKSQIVKPRPAGAVDCSTAL
ncbi:MAG TPA: hypothetical protein PK129_09225 [Cellvibrionaceae bacterium]|nr:hypothetical protein [Cellvibrionaceae bacterium]